MSNPRTPLSTAQAEAVREAQAVITGTRRPTVAALEVMLFEPYPVLDHGFVRLVDYMGDDAAIVQAARVSYGDGTKKTSEDRGLIRYLMRHGHTTPFEMVEFKFHCKMPIFVARQWIRHRTANVNEISGRYSIMKDEFYRPDVNGVRAQSKTNKQGGNEPIDPVSASEFLAKLDQACIDNYATYAKYAEEGVSREVAASAALSAGTLAQVEGNRTVKGGQEVWKNCSA